MQIARMSEILAKNPEKKLELQNLIESTDRWSAKSSGFSKKEYLDSLLAAFERGGASAVHLKKLEIVTDYLVEQKDIQNVKRLSQILKNPSSTESDALKICLGGVAK